MKTALVQLNVSDDPVANLPITLDLIGRAAGQGAKFVLTPETTNCIGSSRAQQEETLTLEEDDQTLAALRAEAETRGIWLLIGSLALKTGEADGRFANRSFMIAPDGAIRARYDKIHMFDVEVSETETYRESAAFRPGDKAVIADTDFAKVGLTVCYDVRFAYLHRALAQGGAEILTVPAAFSAVTGAAHWHPLLRARAIETGTYVLAPAQTGTHAGAHKVPRRTYGHSLVVAPWGEVLLDMGEDPGVAVIDLDLAEVAKARQRVPALSHDRRFSGP